MNYSSLGLSAICLGLAIVTLTILHLRSPYRFADKQNDHKTAWLTIISSLAFVGFALLITLFTKVYPLETFTLTRTSLAQSLVAVIPMLGMLFAIEKTNHPHFTDFRQTQIETFSKIGFRFTPLRIVLMSLGAGIGEEMLFRGALQGWLAAHLPIVIAIIFPALLFGILHNANRTYMIIAALIGIYLGASFAVTNNIAVPIIAHALYDVIALHRAAVLIERYRGTKNTTP